MFRKIAFTAVILVAGLILLHKTNLGSYVGFGWKKGKDLFQKQVPPEVEVERLRHELTQLDPEIKKACSTLAEEAISVQMLREEIDRTQVNLKKRLDEILTMRKDVESGAEYISYGERRLPASRVRTFLASDWESYKRAEEALKSKEKLLEAKEVALTEGHKQLASMRGLKDELRTELDLVEAELKTLRLAQTRSNIQIDNSRLTRFRNSLDELKKRIKVDSKTVEYEGEFANHAIPIEEKKVDVADKALKEIDQRFGKTSAQR